MSFISIILIVLIAVAIGTIVYIIPKLICKFLIFYLKELRREFYIILPNLLPRPLYWLWRGSVVVGKGLSLLFIPSKKTRRFAILGQSKVGKTVLWNKLQGKIEKKSIFSFLMFWKNDKDYNITINKDKIESFILGKNINGDDIEVEVNETYDIGGSDENVNKYYSDLISDGTFVFYLIDLRRMDPKSVDCDRARLLKIVDLKNQNDSGIRIIATFFDKFKGNRKKALMEITNKIFKKKINGVDFSDRVQIVSLTNPDDIEDIKREILKTVV